MTTVWPHNIAWHCIIWLCYVLEDTPVFWAWLCKPHTRNITAELIIQMSHFHIIENRKLLIWREKIRQNLPKDCKELSVFSFQVYRTSRNYDVLCWRHSIFLEQTWAFSSQTNSKIQISDRNTMFQRLYVVIIKWRHAVVAYFYFNLFYM